MRERHPRVSIATPAAQGERCVALRFFSGWLKAARGTNFKRYKPDVNRRNTTQRNGAEAGVALLIALFALLLISVVGVALIVASGTDTALTGNYRSATSVYYAALAGLEEGRGRLLPKSPQNTNLDVVLHLPAGTLPNVGPTSGDVWYILNPLPSEPQDIGLLTLYPDTLKNFPP